MISFIIPFRYNPERALLLEATINNLPVAEDIELCIVELDNTPKLINACKEGFIQFLHREIQIRHKFFKYDGIFHRALAINLGVRELAQGDILAIMEGDIVFRHAEQVIDEIKKVQTPASGFNAMYFMDQDETKQFLLYKEFPNYHESDRLRFSKPNGLAGGLIAIPKDIFMGVKGIPELFEGSWGNDDNAFLYKLDAYGYPFRNLGWCFYHLHHFHRTEKNPDIMSMMEYIKDWSFYDWAEYNDELKDSWGKI